MQSEPASLSPANDAAHDASADAIRARTQGSLAIARMSEGRLMEPRQRAARGLIVGGAEDRDHADTFRELRTRLLAHAGPRNFVTLVVPVSPGCGASFVARNLATAFTFDEAKTALLIDGHLREPRQDQVFGFHGESGVGLIDYLENPDVGIARIIHPTGVPRLRLIPAGRPREASGEYLSSFRMRALVDTLLNRYPDRYLFIDGPPITRGPDARILSELADYVLVVAGYGRDTAPTIRRAASVFDPKKFAGVVFNELP